jgi:hypothetical protein
MAITYEKDSALLELFATEDGYMLRVWKWPTSPPPVPHRNLDETVPTEADGGFRQDHTADDKPELITKITQFINSVFD